jgi:hypothetical protein
LQILSLCAFMESAAAQIAETAISRKL